MYAKCYIELLDCTDLLAQYWASIDPTKILIVGYVYAMVRLSGLLFSSSFLQKNTLCPYVY